VRYVLDASVALKSFLSEPDSAQALRLRDDARAGAREFLAPDFFPTEVAHAITRVERQGLITPAEGASFVSDLLAELPDLHPSLPLIPRAYVLSSLHRQGMYDCAYIALAEREGCPLVTADDKLVKNLGPTIPFLVPLASLP
jgi:predicted nucleic acid-binding protein